MSFIVVVEYNKEKDEYFITLPEELLSQTGWKEGDNINWELGDENNIILTKADTTTTGGNKTHIINYNYNES